MTKAQRINRGMFALGFLGAYSLAAMLLLLTLKTVSADRYTGAGVSHRSAGGDEFIDDFTGDIANAADFQKYPNRLGRDKGDAGASDDATSAIGDGPSAGGFFGDNGFSGAPGDFRQASFVSGGDARGGGRANFAPLITSGAVPDGLFGGGAPGPTFVAFSPGGTGEPSGGEPPAVDTPSPGQPPDVFGPGPFVPGPDDPLPDPVIPPGDPLPPAKQSPIVPAATILLPEPLTLSIFAAGLAGAAVLRRGRKKPA